MAVQFLTDKSTAEETANKWRVKIIQLKDGVNIEIESDNADGWVVFKLRNDGTFHRYNGIGSNSGLRLTKDGKIAESKEEY